MTFGPDNSEHNAAPTVARANSAAFGREEQSRNDTVSLFALAAGFVMVAASPIVMNPPLLLSNLVSFGVFAIVYSIAARIEFESQFGGCRPTMPVFVMALFTLPVTVVPGVVLVGSLLCLVSIAPHEPPTIRTGALRAIDGWYALGPVAVLGATGAASLTSLRWPILVAALALQFTIDATAASIRCAGVEQPLRSLVKPLGFTFAVDALLGLLTAVFVFDSHPAPAMAALVAAPIALLWLLSHDRRHQVETAVDLADAVDLARSEARIDRLTGLLNRRGWDEEVAAARDRLANSTVPLSVAIVVTDINNLKTTNSRFGHDVGDIVIRSFSDVLRVGSPVDAVIARVGSDEFAVLLVRSFDYISIDSTDLLSRLRRSTANARTPHGLSLSASFGIACSPPAGTILEAIRIADRASYADKAAPSESSGDPQNVRRVDKSLGGVLDLEMISA